MPLKVVIIGPAHPLRGGLATFDQRLCRQFLSEGHDCSIFSFSLQYPGFLFPGKTQYAQGPAPEGLKIFSVINSIHPLNWWHVGNQLAKMKPDLIVVRFWLPFMGPALGTILRRARRNKHTRVVAITDNVIPHEKRPGDKAFTRYFLNACDAFITMSENVMHDLRQFIPDKPAMQVNHPLYDNFGPIIPQSTARTKLGINPKENILLFFGFIRPYKGLDLLFRALHILKSQQASAPPGSMPSANPPFRLLVAGEFYEPAEPYHKLIRELGIGELLILKTDFIPDEEVQYYFCAADVVIQPYRSATQSGVTPLAYHFEKPMIVTRVGSLPDMVPHDKVGLVCNPDPDALAKAIQGFLKSGAAPFLPAIREEKQKYSWQKLVSALLSLNPAASH